jgi:hypothetical protein
MEWLDEQRRLFHVKLAAQSSAEGKKRRFGHIEARK